MRARIGGFLEGECECMGASYDQMRARGMLGKPDYHELGVRLAIALSMVEGVYSEAERCSDA